MGEIKNRKLSDSSILILILGALPVVWWLIYYNAYRVNKASEPCGIKTKASKTGCVRNAKKANEIITMEYEKSNGTRVYLGEWHTHLEDYPSPSYVDINSIKNIIETENIPVEGVFLIIVGLKKYYYGFHYNGKLYDVTPEIV